MRITENTMVVGEYEITELEDDTYWIVHDSGEGMQIRKEVFEKLIDEFFEAVF